MLRRRPTKRWASSSPAEGQATVGSAEDLDEELARLGKWCALIINLERRPDRWANSEKLYSVTNPRLHGRIERLDAVDGKVLDLEDDSLLDYVQPGTLERARRAKELGLYTVVHDDKNLLVHFDDHLTEGAIACAMSHHKALERLASHPEAEWGLILEDDVSVVVPQVDRAISRIVKQLPDDWQAVYLGYHHDDGKPHPRGLRSTDKGIADNADVVDSSVGGVYDTCWGLFAWMVKKETAQRLVHSLFPLDTQVDGAISSWLVRCYGPGKVFKVPPEELLFYSSCSEEAQDSDIQTMKLEEKVVEEYGSWSAYMDQTRKRVDDYGGYDPEDFYALFGDYGYGDSAEGYDPDSDDDYDWEPPAYDGDAPADDGDVDADENNDIK